MELVAPSTTGGSSTSGSILTQETPTGTIDAANTSFSVANTPAFVIVDGMYRVAGQGYTFDGVITVDVTVPPVQFIRSFFLASSGFRQEIPTGTVNASNVTFTVLNEPLYVVIDGLVRTSGNGYSYATGTITVDSLAPPVQNIRSYYYASVTAKTLTQETPTGTVNGVNTLFTTANTPLYVIVDGMFRVSGFGYSYAGVTITVDSLAPPVQFIRSFFNA
jgi:hypothetical protein